MVGIEVENKPNLLSCSFGGLFVDINHTTFDYKEELMEELLSSREKYYHCGDVVFDINIWGKVLIIMTSAPDN